MPNKMSPAGGSGCSNEKYGRPTPSMSMGAIGLPGPEAGAAARAMARPTGSNPKGKR